MVLKARAERYSAPNFLVRSAIYGLGRVLTTLSDKPATCPFITSVGATQVSPGAKITDPESACEQVIFSGGGFSNHFAMPEYQKSTVESFLAKFPPPYPKSIWNATGSRAYPDIAANG